MFPGKGGVRAIFFGASETLFQRGGGGDVECEGAGNVGGMQNILPKSAVDPALDMI